MTKDVETHSARLPRHAATPPSFAGILVTRASGCRPNSVWVELVDFSRTGARFRSTVRLAESEAIAVRLEDRQGTVWLTCSAVVRWARPDRAGTWSVGCQLDEPLDLETLGELFLSGVLSTKPPSRQSPKDEPLPPAPIEDHQATSPFPPIERPLGA